MRPITLLIAAGALALSTSAFAAPSVTPNAASDAQVSVQQIHGNAGSAYKIHVTELPGYKGDYQTDAGHMRVSLKGKVLYAQIGDGEKVALVPVSRDTFVTRDTQTRIVFDPSPYDQM